MNTNNIPITRFSDEDLVDMALEMIYQMTGERVPKEEQCRWQGNGNYQIVMTYFEKINNGPSKDDVKNKIDNFDKDDIFLAARSMRKFNTLLDSINYESVDCGVNEIKLGQVYKCIKTIDLAGEGNKINTGELLKVTTILKDFIVCSIYLGGRYEMVYLDKNTILNHLKLIELNVSSGGNTSS